MKETIDNLISELDFDLENLKKLSLEPDYLAKKIKILESFVFAIRSVAVSPLALESDDLRDILLHLNLHISRVNDVLSPFQDKYVELSGR